VTTVGVPSVWRNRDFRLVWTGQTLSELGNGVSQLAYPVLILALTGSPVATGLLVAMRALPYLFLGLFAGALVDLWDRRRTMIVCDLVRAANMATIPAALLLWRLTPEHLVVAGFVGGVCYVFFNAAEGACLPNVVRREQVTVAVSAQKTAQSAVVVVSGALGGILLQLFRGLPFLVDALSFLASATCLALVRRPFRRSDDPPRAATTLRQDIAEGVRWVAHHPVLRVIVVVVALLQVAISGVALVAIVAARDAGASLAATGLMFSALGAGGVAGALLAPRLKRHLGLGRLVLSVLWSHGLLWILLGFGGSLVLTGIAFGLFALTLPCFGTATLSYQLEVTPDHLLGRVGTTLNLVVWAATPIGGVLAGTLLTVFPPRTVSVVFAAWVFALALAATFGSGLRSAGAGTAR
jgi:predicted MFS family arabinose efflux permease